MLEYFHYEECLVKSWRFTYVHWELITIKYKSGVHIKGELNDR